MTSTVSKHHNPDFRGDIEGLRAVAVLAVIGDHMRWAILGGGYVGVDVFFVISGYLISKNLVSSEIDIAEFYRRRAVRILPALILVSLVCLPFASIILLPSELTAFGQSMIWSALSLPNIFFYLNVGYFSPLADSMPLLHTWSLGIEEQFYLFWPLLIIVCQRIRIKVSHLFVFVVVASLLFSSLTVERFPEASFYLLPARAWELALGGVLVFLPALGRLWLRQVFGCAGLLAIAYASTRFSHGTLFPGPAALVPTLGAFAIIWAGHGRGPHTLASWILNLPPARWIGRISYSLYLVHWPIMVFARLRYDWLFSDPVFQAALLAVVFGCGALVWFVAENGVGRVGRAMGKAPVFALAGSAIGVACVIGLGLVAARGLPGRLNPEAQAAATWQGFDGDKVFRGGKCFLVTASGSYDAAECFTKRRGGKTVLLLGDSHSAHLWPGVAAAFADYEVLQANMAGCRPTVLFVGGAAPCSRFMRMIVEQLLPANPVDVVLVSGRWSTQDLKGLDRLVADVSKHAKTVIVTGPVPEYTTSLPRILARMHQGEIAAADLRKHMIPGRIDVDRGVARVLAGSARYVSLIDIICSTSCRTTMADGAPIYFDYGHLTPSGSLYVGRALRRAVDGST